MPKRRRTKITPQEDAQSVATLALFAGFGLAYLGAEAILAAEPHPYHWLAALVGAGLAGGGAYVLTLRRRTHRP